MSLFRSYGEASAQILSLGNCKFYTGSMTQKRIQSIGKLLSFSAGHLPFTSLGVPMPFFKGRPKTSHLQSIAEKIKAKLAAWKGSLLSLMGKVQLVKSIIHGMFVYSLHVYAWPSSLLKSIDRWIRNFIWSANMLTKNLCIVAWKKLCCSYEEGGLNIRSIKSINEAAMLKLAYDLTTSDKHWARLIRARFMNHTLPVLHHVKSSILPGLRPYLQVVKDCTSWIIVDGSRINFWHDKWMSNSMVNILNMSVVLHQSLLALVSDFIKDNSWTIPHVIASKSPDIVAAITKVVIPISQKQDSMVWIDSIDGSLTFKAAYEHLCSPKPSVPWGKIIWQASIPSSRSYLTWRLLHNKFPTDKNLQLRGCNIVSKCDLCGVVAESSLHLFLDCSFADKLWSWFDDVFHV